MTLWGSLGLLGASLATLGSNAGLYAVRTAGLPAHEIYGEEDFDAMLALPKRTVRTEDGVELAVREVGSALAPLTIVFVHGYCLRMQSWHLQMRHLQERWGKDVRMVFYDQRGHGESTAPRSKSCTIAQLGRDLGTVVDTVAPTGPVIVVGHSMGGMTTIALAAQRPELFDERIVGVGLLATTAAGLTKTGIGRNLENPVIDGFRHLARTAPGFVQYARGAAKAIIAPILRAASYGTVVSPKLVEFSDRMLAETSVLTIVNFLRTLELHDESAALPVLGQVPALVLCGDADMIIPFSGSEELAAALPDVELKRVRGAGHLVQLEFPEVVVGALDRLIQRGFAHDAGRRRAAIG
ncbi:alpha/beta fold hydrolase [Rhodococcus rhodochrous]|uniref:Alpha/beta hydrolase n=1 Tax=Rhodococcus rhodochrous KG-21 TaxID=1441923 RepID=A0A0M9WM96_RHORH|nr:alpha/beta hydrolase [Rhodococcus rhodochrous]KOS54260.1 alpha/beta hydrolase [Rhodococcus rhodochrous KG-21]